MNYLWNVFEIFANLSYGILWCYFIVKYFGFKEHVKAKYLLSFLFSLILCGIISIFNYFIIYEGFLITIYSILIFIFAIIFLNGNLWEKLLVSILKQVILVGIAFIIPMLVSLMVEENIANMMIMEFSIFRFIIIVLIFVIYLLILKLILYLKKEFHEMTKLQWSMIILISIISLILIISIMEIILTITTNKSYYFFLVVSVISIITLNVLIYVFMGILNRNNKLITKYQLENQQKLYEEKNIDNIKNMYEKIRILKHDMKHHNDFIVSKIIDTPEINSVQRKYLSNILSHISEINENIEAIKSTIYTENQFIDSLLNYKIGMAKDKNIQVETIIDKNIPKISDVDLCCILGNMLDNAIEACESDNIENKIIILHMTVKNSCLMICVKNSISKSIISSNPNFITTKQNKEIHGIGLKSMKSIAEKYSGSFKISEQEEKFFITEVLLVGNEYGQIET
jgi:hypothetical protein